MCLTAVASDKVEFVCRTKWQNARSVDAMYFCA